MSDRMERVTVLILGLFLLLLADGVLASGSGIGGLTASILLWGLHMGFTQGARGSDRRHRAARAARYCLRNAQPRIRPAQLCASVVAGALWDALGPQSTFLAGAAFVILTLAGLLPVCRRLRGSSTTVRA